MNIDNEIDRIVNDVSESIENGEGVALDYYHPSQDLKDAIKRLVLQAKIDILTNFKYSDYDGYYYTDYGSDVSDQIAQLTQELNELEGEK